MATQTIKGMLTAALAAGLLVLSGCSLPQLKMPRVHKIPVQQGNVITQEMVDRLKPGMSRSQVAYVMGEPVLRNTFDDSKWEYIYTLDIPGVLAQTVRMTLYFEDDALAYFTGDLAPTAAKSDVYQPDVTGDDNPAESAGSTPATTPASSTGAAEQGNNTGAG